MNDWLVALIVLGIAVGGGTSLALIINRVAYGCWYWQYHPTWEEAQKEYERNERR